MRFRGLLWCQAVDTGDTLPELLKLPATEEMNVPQYEALLLPSTDQSSASLAVHPSDHCDESRGVASWSEVHSCGSTQCCVHFATFSQGCSEPQDRVHTLKEEDLRSQIQSVHLSTPELIYQTSLQVLWSGKTAICNRLVTHMTKQFLHLAS